MRRFLLAMLLLTPAVAYGQRNCPGGVCPAPAVEQLHGWYDGGDGKLNLYWRGELAGTLDPLSSEWKTDGKTQSVNLCRVFGIVAKIGRPKECVCGDDCECERCPRDCIAGAAPAAARQNFGVDWSKMQKDGRELYRIGGAEVPERQVYAALGGASQVPDDAKIPRLVVLGSAEGRRKVLDDWSTAPGLAPFRDKAIVQAYPPDHWHVAEVGYKQFGDPTIYLVDARGKVATWQKDYDGGPERLAKTLSEGLRIADPSFDPAKSPDLSKPCAPKRPDNPKPSVTFELTANHAGAAGLAGLASLAGLFVCRGRKRD